MKKATLIGVVMGVLSTMTIAAQTPPPIMPILSVTRVVVKPDRLAEWQDLETLYSAAYKKGGGAWRRFYRARAGNVYEFLVLAPMSSYADLDGQSFIAKGASEQDIARWAARRSQCTESVTVSYERLVPDAIINQPGASLPAMLLETRFRVRPGMGEDFSTFIKTEALPWLKKAGVGLFVLRTTQFGASRNLYTTRRGFTTFAELDTNLLEKTLGKDGAARYLAKSASMITDSETRLYAYVAAISHAGAQ